MSRRLGGLLALLQKRETRRRILGNLVTCWHCVQCAFFGLTTEVVKGHGLAAFENLLATMKEISFSGFFALYAVSHDVCRGYVLGELKEMIESSGWRRDVLGLREALKNARLFQRRVGPIFRNRLESPRRELHRHKPILFRHPNPLGLEIGEKSPAHNLCHVLANAAFFLS